MPGAIDSCTLLKNAQGTKWEQRHAELARSHDLAGIFLGWIPQGYFAEGKPRVLYVGKATSGPFTGLAREKHSFNGSGPFWNFARTIATSLGCSTVDLSCIAWSNISKLSLRQIVADASLLEGLEQEATSTLEAEITSATPHVLVFVTAHFSDSVVRQIAQGPEDSMWNKSELESQASDETDIWWRRRKDGVAVVWMRHPQGAHRVKLSFASRKIASLVRLHSE